MANERERFFAKVAEPNEQGCQLWTSAIAPTGYGVMRFEGKTQYVHRIAWFYHTGQWPAATNEIDHLCYVRACVAPAHLEEVSRRINNQRKDQRYAGTRTICKQGMHPWIPENISPTGVCRLCRNIRSAGYKMRKRRGAA